MSSQDYEQLLAKAEALHCGEWDQDVVPGSESWRVPTATIREMIYDRGQSVLRGSAADDVEAATQLFLQCAAMGHSGCQNQLGLIMLGKQERELAAMWFNRAVNNKGQHSVDAMFHLGILLGGGGVGGSRDGADGSSADEFERALLLLSDAAAGGHLQAQAFLRGTHPSQHPT